jgi:hypothetical protein
MLSTIVMVKMWRKMSMNTAPMNSNSPTSERRSIQEIRSVNAPKPKRKRNRIKIFLVSLVAIIVIAALVLGGLFVYKSNINSTIDSNRYQAVFFTNGQVYFGKLQILNSSYLKLTDIYYLQTKTNTSSTNPQTTTASTANDVQLVKLGSEIHGPDDQMVINNYQVIFFDNIKSDGKVTQSIAKYQAK